MSDLQDSYRGLETDYYTFDLVPRLSRSAIAARDSSSECNLVTLLAVAQNLQIPFLSTTWEPKETMVGKGVTSQRTKLDDPVHTVYRRVINEIMLLHHPGVRTHPNILELLGLTWEFSANRNQGDDSTKATLHQKYNVWPVLVFERSIYGDLYHFSKLPMAKELDTIDRIKICLDVGAAVGHMQTNHVAHGDIKPHNILIFEDSQTGFFIAKVADFGFSAAYSHENLRITLGGTPLWSAPEVTSYPDLSQAQAMTSDVFSFGMLCLWFIFERQLSGELPLPDATSGLAAQLDAGEHQSLSLLKHLKERNCLAEFANQLVDAQTDLSETSKQSLREMFTGCLNSEPLLRDAGMVHTLRHLGITLFRDVLVPPTETMPIPFEDGFNLCKSIGIYYTSDFRIRWAILQSLEAIVAERPASPLSRQLAFCYEIGFGHSASHVPDRAVARNETELQQELRNAMEDELKDWNQQGNARRRSGIHQVSLGLIIDEYLLQGLLETAEQITRHEITRLEASLGASHLSEIVLRHFLAGIVSRRGHWEEAQTLREKIADTTIGSLGKMNMTTLTNLEELAFIYHSQSSFEEAEKLEMEIMDLKRELLGEEHLETLATALSLAVTIYQQGRLQEAQRRLLEIVGSQRDILGPEHPQTVSSLGWLAAVLCDKGSTQEALNWGSQALEICQRKLGLDHPKAAEIMEIMVRIHMAENRFEEAEQMQVQSLKTKAALFDDEHPELLMSMHNLAYICNHMGKHSDAQRLLTTCAETRLKVLGPEHPDTRETMKELKRTTEIMNETLARTTSV